MTLSRRHLLQSCLGTAGLSLLQRNALAQSMDTARILAGFPAGSPIDAVCRAMAEKLRPGYARSLIVENRAGVGGQLAAQALKTASPDGSTLLVTPMTILGVYPHTYKKLSYDPVADFIPVSNCVTYGYGLAVGSAVPAAVTTIPQFMEWLKAHPDKANFGTAATGSTLHFTGVRLGRAAGVELTHVGYTNGGNMLNDLAGGSLPACVSTISTLLPFHQSGRLRVIGTSGAQRSRFLPQAPTFSEAGYKDMVFSEWYGFFLPARTPQEQVNRLNAAVAKALAAPEVVEALAGLALEVTPSSPTELAELLRRDTELWGQRIKSIGFTSNS